MNKAQDFNKRKGRPQTLGGAFGDLLRKFGRHSSDADLVARWVDIMGPEIAGIADLVSISKIKSNVSSRARQSRDPGPGHSQGIENVSDRRNINNPNSHQIPDNFSHSAKNFRDDTLGRVMTVRAKNPAAALALSYKVADIRAAANKYFGYDAVVRVIVKK
ncbi:MAG: DUF721 domain-containing protein [Rickettsiales bacterium]|jgi:hypothetical protein|nr:DUF721 domain-containing protein [Rickettsiales bacterium]